MILTYATPEDLDPVPHLKNDKIRCHYLEDVLAEDDAPAFMEALADVVRARGVAKTAMDCRITREHLHRLLRGDAEPRLSTFLQLMRALGYRVKLQPEKRRHARKHA